LSDWKKIFVRWPKDMARGGVLITRHGEQVPFVAFMTADEFLLIQRHAPDSVGARMVVCPYDEIVGLKLTEAPRQKPFQELGFEGALSKH